MKKFFLFVLIVSFVFSAFSFFATKKVFAYDQDYPVAQPPTTAKLVKYSVLNPVGQVANTYTSIFSEMTFIYKDGTAAILKSVKKTLRLLIPRRNYSAKP